MGLFSDIFGGAQYTPVSGAQQAILRDWLKLASGGGWQAGSGARTEQSALNDLFSGVANTEKLGTPFFESMIPSTPGALSPAAAAEKAASMDALQSSLGGERVAQLGQLGREYGGRLPASMVQSGLGGIARAGAGGATDIARNAVMENINLGEQGVQGLAGLNSLQTLPFNTLNSLQSGANSGMYMDPGIIGRLANAGKSIAGSIAGFAGLGGRPTASPFGATGGYGVGAAGLGPMPGTMQPSMYGAPNKLYSPTGLGG